MERRSYPHGIDTSWLASDKNGHLGLFITAGAGPIPMAALGSPFASLDDLEEQVWTLPIVAAAKLLVSVNRPEDFIGLAQRGIFTYDWSDVHRSTRSAVHAYEMVAAPDKPIELTSLPVNMAHFAGSVRFSDVVFASEKIIDIRALASCSEANMRE